MRYAGSRVITERGTTYQPLFYEEAALRLRRFMESEETHRHWKVQKAHVLKLLKPQKEDSFLDIGCGPGRLEIFLSQIAQVTGIDISEEALQQARQNVEWYGNPKNASFKCFNRPLRSLLPGQKFNKVFMADSSEHMPRKVFLQILDEIRDLLTEDGLLMIYTPNKNYFTERLRPVSQSGHINVMSMRELTRVLTSRGYAVVEQYHETSHIPALSLLEKMMPRFLRRRLCLKAQVVR